MKADISTVLRIIAVLEVARRLNIGRSTLYDYLNEKSPRYKPDLPQPVRLGATVGFLEHEIDEYILGLMRARGGDVGR